MVQPLANVNRKPQTGGYTSHSFYAFAVEALSKTVVLTPGAYALAYRFVNSATGQEVALVPLTTVVVS